MDGIGKGGPVITDRILGLWKALWRKRTIHTKLWFWKCSFSKPVTEQAEAMTNVLTNAFQKFVPSKTIVIRVSDQPCVNSYTRLLLRKKNRNYQFYKKVNNSYLTALSNHGDNSQVVTRLFEKRKLAQSKANISSQESTSANRRAKQAFFNTVTSTMHTSLLVSITTYLYHYLSLSLPFCINTCL